MTRCRPSVRSSRRSAAGSARGAKPPSDGRGPHGGSACRAAASLPLGLGCGAPARLQRTRRHRRAPGADRAPHRLRAPPGAALCEPRRAARRPDAGRLRRIDQGDRPLRRWLWREPDDVRAPNILGEIKRHFRDRGWAVRVPREIQELNVKLARVVDELTASLGRSPSVDELANATQTTPENVLEALESSSAYSTLSLSDRPTDDDDTSGPMDTLGEEDDELERSQERMTLALGLRRLHAREPTI